MGYEVIVRSTEGRKDNVMDEVILGRLDLYTALPRQNHTELLAAGSNSSSAAWKCGGTAGQCGGLDSLVLKCTGR